MPQANEDSTEKIEKTSPPREVRPDSAISGQAQQKHWKDMDKAHWLEQDESATGLFFKPGDKNKSSSKFGIDGLEPEKPKKNADGSSYEIYTQPASMSPTKIDPISPELTRGDFQSSVKLNVQISQIPEVSPPLNAGEALDYTAAVLAAGAEAVRKTEHHLTEPNAINNDIAGGLEHLSRSPNQTNADVRSAFAGLMEELEKTMTPEERAEMAGTILPMFFFAGEREPIHPRVARGMGIDKMSAEELGALSLERRNTLARETIGEVDPRVYERPSQVVQERVSELTKALPPELSEHVSMSVAVAENAEGKRSLLIGTSDRYGYLRGIDPNLGDTLIVGPNRQSELDLLEYAGEYRLKLINVGSTRPISALSAGKIAGSGAQILTPVIEAVEH